MIVMHLIRPASTCVAYGVGAVLVASVIAQPARAAGVEDFYKGKSVSLVIGYSVGGGYDAYGRLVARHLGKYIPGQPNVVAQNMTGAGSLKAANYIYAVAPKDGLVIGTFSRSQGIAPLLGKAEFDSTKFSWIGSVTDEVSLCVTRHDSAVKTFNDFLDVWFTPERDRLTFLDEWHNTAGTHGNAVHVGQHVAVATEVRSHHGPAAGHVLHHHEVCRALASVGE